MRKRELVQLHALLAAVRERFEERLDVEEGAFEEYEEYGVAPTAIHRNKGDHHEAIRRLLDGLGSTAGEPSAGAPGEEASAGSDRGEDGEEASASA